MHILMKEESSAQLEAPGPRSGTTLREVSIIHPATLHETE